MGRIGQVADINSLSSSQIETNTTIYSGAQEIKKEKKMKEKDREMYCS